MTRSIRNTTVAVTGGAGFLGSHLVDHLIYDRNCEVVVIDNLCSGRREFVNPYAKFEYADIAASEHRLFEIFRGCKVQFVFSYAAHPYIPVSFSRPKHVVDTNFTGAVNVINAAQEAGCEGILQVSSAEIYGEGQTTFHHIANQVQLRGMTDGPIHELSPVVPHSTYGVSKAAVDGYVQCRWKEAKTPCIALRQFNCAGERETHPYVIPEIISQLYKGDGQRVYLGNNSYRDFLYAGDAVKAAVELLEFGQFGEVYNLGSESGIQIYDLAEMLGRVVGMGRILVEKDPARVRPWEIWHLLSDNSKIKEVFAQHDDKCSSLKSIMPLEETLRLTVKSYVDNGKKWVWE